MDAERERVLAEFRQKTLRHREMEASYVLRVLASVQCPRLPAQSPRNDLWARNEFPQFPAD